MYPYLTQWKWNTDESTGGPFWEIPKAIGLVDLRSLSEMGTQGPTPLGYALAVFAEPITDPSAISLGDSLAGLRNKAALETELGLGAGEIVATNTRDALWELLNQHADPIGASRWKPLMPSSRRVMELHLDGLVRQETFDSGLHPLVLQVEQENYRRIREDTLAGEIVNRDPQFHRRYLQGLVEKYGLGFETFIPSDLPVETPLPHGTTVTDDFNRADADSLGGSWTEVSGDIDIVTNAAAVISGTDPEARYETDLATDDHYAQIVGLNCDAWGQNGGPTTRFASAAETYYRFVIHTDNNFYFQKNITGSLTTIESTGVTRGANDLIRGESNGSSHTSLQNGFTRQGPTTDTAISGNLRAGIAGNSGSPNSRIDDFEAADLAAAVGDWPETERNMPRGVGRGILSGVV